ncbi:hypothetical protein DMO17_08000 [Aquipseudomonas alcaligenes]|uniref:Uncharacterized protein n=1 Tax=Aquipseudomonas alcaligenes TaxID=43263 RepID=A0A2V4M6B3_AQUAC|nr:hypothetical protein [Pseudomonas alcaligenes]PYC25626.1 hypothetical protein DMO17_08000 [Pseudomonas alcaligenes]
MATALNDRLQKTLDGINVDSRLSTWLWFFLKSQTPYAYLGELGSPGMRDRMADHIQNAQIRKEFVEEQSALALLPEKDLEWITSNKRQNFFVAGKLIEKNDKIPIISQNNLTGRALTIATIDIWGKEKNHKSWLISEIRSEWEQHSSTDYIFKWFDSPDTKQRLEIAWEIAKSKYPVLTLQQNTPQDKDEFIILLDYYLTHTSDKILLMNSIKKRWSQNKYRTKLTGKKQYNFILSDKAIQRLDKLAEKYDLRRTEVLEILLKMEEEKGAYIPERLRPLKDI